MRHNPVIEALLLERRILTAGPWFHPGGVRTLDWDPRGRHLLSTGPRSARVWRAETGELVRTFSDPSGRFVFSHDGAHVIGATARDGLRFWSLEDGSPSRYDDSIVAIEAADPAKRFALVRLRAGSCAVIDLREGRVVRERDLSRDRAVVAAFEPDGTRLFLATGSADATGEVWDFGTGAVAGPVGDRAGNEVLWARGRLVVTCLEGMLVLDAGTFAAAGPSPFAAAASTAACTPDGERFAASVAGAIVLLRRDGSRIRSLPVRAGALAFSPDGRRLASASTGVVFVHDVETGEEIGGRQQPPADDIARIQDRRLSTSPRGDLVLVQQTQGYVAVDAKTLEVVRDVRWGQHGPEDFRLFLGSHRHRARDGSLHADWWPFERHRDHEPHGMIVWRGDRDPMSGLVQQHNDTRVGPLDCDGVRVASGQTDLVVWELASGRILRTIRARDGQPAYPPGFLTCVAFSPGGERVYAGSGNTVSAWDADTGERIATWSTPGLRPQSLACGPRGIAVGGHGRIEVRSPAGEVLASSDAHEGERVASLLWVGDTLFSSGNDRGVCAWKLPTTP